MAARPPKRKAEPFHSSVPARANSEFLWRDNANFKGSPAGGRAFFSQRGEERKGRGAADQGEEEEEEGWEGRGEERQPASWSLRKRYRILRKPARGQQKKRKGNSMGRLVDDSKAKLVHRRNW